MSGDRKRVGFVTGSRADYGIMRNFLKLLDEDGNILLDIITTGALLSEKYGRQVELIYKDGFHVSAEIGLTLDSSSNEKVLFTMSEALGKFAAYFNDNPYDLLLILGDRYEMLPAALAAAMQRIPILHIHGGEATYGNYDEFIRHAITKMSRYHFTSTEVYRERVIQLGENPGNVFNLGALGAENCLRMDEENVTGEVKQLEKGQYFVILFHPETLTGMDVVQQGREILMALENYPGYKLVFIGVNADTDSDLIRGMVSGFVASHKNAVYFENLHTDAYHYLLKHGICLVGNSSSGIIEAPSLGINTVNIGNRQKGRVRGESVMDVGWDAAEIKAAMDKTIKKCGCIGQGNPYFQENAAKNYYQKTLELLSRVEEDRKEPKEFYDLKGMV